MMAVAASIMMEDVLTDEDEHGIRARFVTETVTYHYFDDGVGESAPGSSSAPTGALVGANDDDDTTTPPPRTTPLHVHVCCATTTLGGPLTSSEHDSTGILIWPATHLLCQHLVMSRSTRMDMPFLTNGSAVVELGCGVGLVGITAIMATDVELWVCTDMDERCLRLCRTNYELNGISVTDDAPDARAWVRSLSWGDEAQCNALLESLMEQKGKDRFDAVFGADIVYPSTSGQALQYLFDSVNQLLKLDDGIFYLSFATRDGYKTTCRLIEAASQAGFRIDRLDPLDPTIAHLLPPLLDSVVLVLRRDHTARERNTQLGGEQCLIFPRLQSSISRANEDTSDEEWNAPFDDKDSDDDNDS